MNAVFKGARQLGRLNGNVLLVSQNIAERQTDELYVVFLNKLYDFAHGGIHTESLLFFYPDRRKSSDVKSRTGLSIVLRLEGVKLLDSLPPGSGSGTKYFSLFSRSAAFATEMTGSIP